MSPVAEVAEVVALDVVSSPVAEVSLAETVMPVGELLVTEAVTSEVCAVALLPLVVDALSSPPQARVIANTVQIPDRVHRNIMSKRFL